MTPADAIVNVMRGHVGKGQAIKRDALLVAVNRALSVRALPPIDDRELRRTYIQLAYIRGNFGLCEPATWGDVLEFERYIFSKIPGAKAAAQVNIVKAAYARLAPVPVQQNLFGEFRP